MVTDMATYPMVTADQIAEPVYIRQVEYRDRGRDSFWRITAKDGTRYATNQPDWATTCMAAKDTYLPVRIKWVQMGTPYRSVLWLDEIVGVR